MAKRCVLSDEEFAKAYSEVLLEYKAGNVNGSRVYLKAPWGWTPYSFDIFHRLTRMIHSKFKPGKDGTGAGYRINLRHALRGIKDDAINVLSNDKLGKKYLSGEMALSNFTNKMTEQFFDILSSDDVGIGVHEAFIALGAFMENRVLPAEEILDKKILAAMILHSAAQELEHIIDIDHLNAAPAFLMFQLLHAQYYLQINDLFTDAVSAKIKRKAQTRMAGKTSKDKTAMVREILACAFVGDDYSDLSAKQAWRRILRKPDLLPYEIDDNCGDPRLILTVEAGKEVYMSHNTFRRYWGKIKREGDLNFPDQ